MKKGLFEKLLFDTPTWLITTLVYGIGGGIIFLLLFGGCAPLEPLPGLCYTDKTGTYLCPKEEIKETPKERSKADARRACQMWIGTDWWFECMNNEN